MNHTRCPWANQSDIEREYHDSEWGVPVHDDDALFERLVLETMQAGLSWRTILAKREGFRAAFDGFDCHTMASYGEGKVEELMQNTSIVRNGRKILAAIQNAKATLALQKEFGSLDQYFWSFVDFKPIIGHYAQVKDVPATTPLSDKISKDLKKRGFSFVGSTTIYAFMQSIGMVDDHLETCFCRRK